MTAYRPRLLRSGIVLAIAMTLGACASTPHHHAAQDQLLTTITPAGLKQFTFIETMQHSSGGWHGHGGGGMGAGMGHMGGGMAGGGGMGHGGGGMGGGYGQNSEARHERLQEAVKQRLEDKLAATGYCRNGYTQLDSQFQHGKISINGQCTEPATAQDRSQFPNAAP